jgi:AAT family amino acid transporter
VHGNALGFFDWLVLWTLFYVVGLESFGLVRRPAAAAAPAPTPAPAPAPMA